jgi:cell division protein ZapA (FtsZ GTPase activity inhibitor)
MKGEWEGEKQTPITAEIRLLGQRIPLKTTDNDPEFTAEVIELVSNRLEAVEKRLTGQKSRHQVTLLALLDLAEEYVRAKKRTAQYKSEIEARAAELEAKLQSSLHSNPCTYHEGLNEKP